MSALLVQRSLLMHITQQRYHPSDSGNKKMSVHICFCLTLTPWTIVFYVNLISIFHMGLSVCNTWQKREKVVYVSVGVRVRKNQYYNVNALRRMRCAGYATVCVVKFSCSFIPDHQLLCYDYKNGYVKHIWWCYLGCAFLNVVCSSLILPFNIAALPCFVVFLFKWLKMKKVS